MAHAATRKDADLLVEFLQKTRHVLRSVVDAREVLFRKPVRDLFVDSWKEVEQDIESVMTELQQRDFPSEELGAVGLSGVQLQLKLAGFDRVFFRFIERGTTKLLRKLMSWMNKILGSLISAIPGAEAIKEFKDAAEEELDDSDPI